MDEQPDEQPDDICPRPDFVRPLQTQPLSPPIYTSAVYRCTDPDQASRLLSGEEAGYVYSRDGHPNADLLAEKCRALHAAERATVCASGMSALALAALAMLEQGDHVVVSDMLYGRTLQLFTKELPRFGVSATVVDTCDLEATRRAAATSRTRLLIVETITNPLLRVTDLSALAEIAHRAEARLLVDNTFAGPTICRPLEFGADLVVESLTKVMSGHSDVVLGLLCGREASWQRMTSAQSTWGLASSPFDCWLALRGLGTCALRVERAAANAQAAAEFLAERKEIKAVYFPGLADHPDHQLARRQFAGDSQHPRFGTIVTFTFDGGRPVADSFIRAALRIPFCPSLGDLSTTLSHPETTSHRGLSVAQREALAITGGTIRLSLGIESTAAVLDALQQGLAAIADGRK
jgi:cystathionine beta-lyase/cystathionine gamma-synthase